jgi:serine/threonine protein kinase/tetratricopeptide (TPR) repeat protein
MEATHVIANRFELVRLIRQGGIGEVYEGIDRQTGEAVAVKRLKTDIFGEDQDSIQRFVREGNTLRALDHPNIIKIIDTVHEGGRHYLVMAYAAGGSLADVLRQQPHIPIKRAVQIGLDLADALTRAHRLKIIHRDIKPDNVLMAADGTPLLSDFGLARIDSSTITQSGVMVGTYLYLPPEAFNGRPIDARGDIWAFGVMLYQMLAGRCPFVGETPAAIMMTVMNHPTPDLEALRPDAPVALIDLVYRMLEKNPQQRVQSMRQVGAELEMVLRLADSVLAAHPSTPINRSAFVSTPLLSQTSLIPNNLTPQPTPFVGREAELTELGKMVGEPATRLVTILGPGGIGKTRLALELAERQLATSSDGVYFVALAPLTEPDRIVSAIADAIGFSFYEASAPENQLLNYLREKRMLLLLDNFEHLMAGAQLLTRILRDAPHVRLLVTSRERLNLQGESAFVIDGMLYPIQLESVEALVTPDEAPTDAAIQNFPAIKLFIQAAKRQKPDLTLDGGDLRSAARICQLVQGFPLGIELAAAWVESLPLADIVEEIKGNLDFLETEMRDIPERQRSIRAVFNYTWQLLTEPEQDAFKRLSVFRGGFTRDAAQHIAGANLRTLTHLISKSLLRRVPDGRYSVHELLRQYAEGKLIEDAPAETAIRGAHSAYYLEFVATRSGRLKNRDQTSALNEIETELDNIRVAWNQAIICQDVAHLYPALEPLWNFHVYRDRLQEGEVLFGQAVESLQALPRSNQAKLTLGLVMGLHAILAHRLGLEAVSRQQFHDANTLLEGLNARRELALVNAWNTLGTTDEVAARTRWARATFEELGDRWAMASACLSLGLHINFYGSWPDAKRYLLESLELTRAIGDPLGQAGALSCLGWNCFQTGEYHEGHTYFEEGRRIYLHTNTPGGVASVLRGMGTIDWLRGRYDEAEKYLKDSLQLYRKFGSRWGIAPCLAGIGIVAWRRGRPEDALAPVRESVEIYRELGVPRSVSNALVNLGHPLVDLGRDQEALGVFREALAIAVEAGAILQILEAMAGIGAIYGFAAREEVALELLSFAHDHPSVSAEVRGIAERYMDSLDWQIRFKLAPDQVADLIASGRQLTIEEAVKIANMYPAELSPLPENQA